MKQLLLTIVIVFSLVALTSAQNRFSIKDRVDRLKERLSLTDTQTAQVDSILTAVQDSAKNITASGPERREAMRQLMMQSNTDIEKILTDTQKAEYEKMLEERRSRMQNQPNRNN